MGLKPEVQIFPLSVAQRPSELTIHQTAPEALLNVN